jgi:hypothetical protein
MKRRGFLAAALGVPFAARLGSPILVPDDIVWIGVDANTGLAFEVPAAATRRVRYEESPGRTLGDLERLAGPVVRAPGSLWFDGTTGAWWISEGAGSWRKMA